MQLKNPHYCHLSQNDSENMFRDMQCLLKYTDVNGDKYDQGQVACTFLQELVDIDVINNNKNFRTKKRI